VGNIRRSRCSLATAREWRWRGRRFADDSARGVPRGSAESGRNGLRGRENKTSVERRTVNAGSPLSWRSALNPNTTRFSHRGGEQTRGGAGSCRVDQTSIAVKGRRRGLIRSMDHVVELGTTPFGKLFAGDKGQTGKVASVEADPRCFSVHHKLILCVHVPLAP